MRHVYVNRLSAATAQLLLLACIVFALIQS